MPQAFVGREAVSCPARESLVPLALGADDPIIARHVAGCADCRLEVGQLREAAGVLRGPAALERLAKTPECLDEFAVADFVEGRLAPQARVPIVAHLLTCARCRSVVRATGCLLADPGVAAEGSSRRLRRWLLPLGLAAAAAVVLLVWPGTEETRLPPSTRGPIPGSAVGPALIAPRASVARVDRFIWSRVPRVARYRLRLYDAEGSVLWMGETADTVVPRADSVTLSPGVSYFWKVEAQVESQRWAASDLVEFQLTGTKR
jgi:hypothetical protein